VSDLTIKTQTVPRPRAPVEEFRQAKAPAARFPQQSTGGAETVTYSNELLDEHAGQENTRTHISALLATLQPPKADAPKVAEIQPLESGQKAGRLRQQAVEKGRKKPETQLPPQPVGHAPASRGTRKNHVPRPVGDVNGNRNGRANVGVAGRQLPVAPQAKQMKDKVKLSPEAKETVSLPVQPPVFEGPKVNGLPQKNPMLISIF
jgi:hypothetical protein